MQREWITSEVTCQLIDVMPDAVLPPHGLDESGHYEPSEAVELENR